MKKKALVILLIFIFLGSYIAVFSIKNNDIDKTFSPQQNKNVKFNVTANKVVTAGQLFTISFIVNDYSSDFKAPHFTGIQVVSGPSTLSSQSYSYINGKATKEISTSYTYRVIAKKEGKIKINSAQVIVGGKTYSTKPFEITVVAGQNNNSNSQNGNLPDDDISNQVFIRTSYSKSKMYPGEHIIATTKLYTQIDIRDIKEVSSPKFTGFWSKDIESPQNLTAKREVLNGKTYSAAIVRQTVIFAQKKGKFNFKPFSIEITIKQKVGEEIDFFGRRVNRYAYVNKTITGNTANVVVRPFPVNPPKNFSGIVGNSFSIKTDIDKDSIKTDESINYKIKITGNGNLYLLNEIKTNFPTEFDSYKPQTSGDIKYSTSGALGYKTFKYILLAREFGNPTIKPIDFIYFNTKSKKFETISSQNFKINIEKGENYVVNSDAGTRILNKDIRYIKDKNFELKKKTKHFSNSKKLYFSYFGLIIAFILFIFIRKKVIKESSDFVKIKNRKAAKISQQRLKIASEFLKQNLEIEFYAEINRSLSGYLSDKLNINFSFTTKLQLEEILLKKGFDENFTSKLTSILNTCEFAQYGPVGNNQTPEDIYFETEKIINKLENTL